MSPSPVPDPTIIMQTLSAYQQTQALKAAIELEIFTHIADGATSAAEIAKKAGAPERGIRILCDYLTIYGFLTKSSGAYGLSPTAQTFLNKKSPAYMGSIANFLAADTMVDGPKDLAGIIRGTKKAGGTTLDPDDPMWVEFARSMVSFVGMSANVLGKKLAQPSGALKVLDIAAGHGMFGIAVAQQSPGAEIYAVDWAPVLAVARENAEKFGVGKRYHTIPGSAFDVDLGKDYDLVLLPNFLHHFDPPTNVGLLKRIRAAMKPGGRVATSEFVPNEDRVSPLMPASFSMMMLAGTPSGDAYTFPELSKMFQDAGFGESKIEALEPTPQSLILTTV